MTIEDTDKDDGGGMIAVSRATLETLTEGCRAYTEITQAKIDMDADDREFLAEAEEALTEADALEGCDAIPVGALSALVLAAIDSTHAPRPHTKPALAWLEGVGVDITPHRARLPG